MMPIRHPEQTLNGPSLINLLEQSYKRERSNVAKCGACSTDPCIGPWHHCQTYIGPRFGERERVLFVGLDHGMATTRGECSNLLSRQKEILGQRNNEKRSWNLHYKGCMMTASALFDLPCTYQCIARCRRLPEKDCSLLHIAQANIVKSVLRDKKDRTFDQSKKLAVAIPELLAEVEYIRPTVIILHGRCIHLPFPKHVAHAHQFELIKNSNHLAKVSWKFVSPFESLIAFFRHPARGWLQRDWDSIILPTMEAIRKELY
jgi:hypothetical protein